MPIGDDAAAAGYPLVPDTGEEGRTRWGGREINRTRDFIALVKKIIPVGKSGYRSAAGIQQGSVAITFTNDAAKTGSVVFSPAFAAAPVVVVAVKVGSNFDVLVNLQSTSAASFGWRVWQESDNPFTGTVTLYWIAIGS